MVLREHVFHRKLHVRRGKWLSVMPLSIGLEVKYDLQPTPKDLPRPCQRRLRPALPVEIDQPIVKSTSDPDDAEIRRDRRIEHRWVRAQGIDDRPTIARSFRGSPPAVLHEPCEKRAKGEGHNNN